jgi:hypothetical protein
MTFIHHNYLGDLELNCKTTESIRLYNLPSGKWVPSITSVTSFYNREIFVKWRRELGLKKQIVLQKEQQQEELIFTKSAKTIWRIKNLCGKTINPYQSLCSIMRNLIWIR